VCGEAVETRGGIPLRRKDAKINSKEVTVVVGAGLQKERINPSGVIKCRGNRAELKQFVIGLADSREGEERVRGLAATVLKVDEGVR